MCGIAGTYQIPDGGRAARLMGDVLWHRGPDDSGFHAFTSERVTAHLSHRRLSIIDLAHGHQPLVKQGLALVYNGELYNYHELHAELEGRGAEFKTDSDTEVVLEAWRQWGPGCLSRFRGMFALAVLDERTGHLYLARDPFGIKPLHILRRGRGIAFASELKATVAAYGADLHMDAGSLAASMLYYWIPDQRCAIREVRKVQPGTCVEVRPDGTESVSRYWISAEVAAGCAAGPAADLAAVVEDSVRAHLVSDVPVASFLSGGLDSSIVTVLAQRGQAEIDAYTIAFRREDQRLEAMPDDAVYAHRLADDFGIKLHEIVVRPDIVDLLPRMVGILDEPIGDAAAINTFLMCEAARDAGVKVILSGMGADEFFGGYRKHVACLLADRYGRVPAGMRSALRTGVEHLPVRAVGRGLRYTRWAKRFLTFAELPEEAAFRRSYSLFDPDELSGLLGPELRSEVPALVAEHADVYCDNRLGDQVNRMCLADSRYFLPGLNLTYTDRASMAASTEVRVPFVDPYVFRAAFSLSGRDKIDGRTGKVALKRAAADWLPDWIINRPKASFSAPLRAWIDHDLRDLVDEAVLRGELVSTGLVSQPAVQQLIDDERRGRQDRSKQLWQLLTLELWYRRNRDAGVTL